MVANAKQLSRVLCCLSLTWLLFLMSMALLADEVGKGDGVTDFTIQKAVWRDGLDSLVVGGSGASGKTVTVSNADTTVFLGSDSVGLGGWRVRLRDPKSVPCRIFASQSDGQFAERVVEGAPNDCDNGGLVGTGRSVPAVSADTTGQDLVPGVLLAGDRQ